MQDQLKQEADYVIQKLLRESGHLYVCGDVSMAADVYKTIEVLLDILWCVQVSKHVYVRVFSENKLGCQKMRLVHLLKRCG